MNGFIGTGLSAAATGYLRFFKRHSRNRLNISGKTGWFYAQARKVFMKTQKKRPKPRKIREQEFMDSFDMDIADEYDEIFEKDDTSFHDMHHRIERDRSLGRDELHD